MKEVVVTCNAPHDPDTCHPSIDVEYARQVHVLGVDVVDLGALSECSITNLVEFGVDLVLAPLWLPTALPVGIWAWCHTIAVCSPLMMRSQKLQLSCLSLLWLYHRAYTVICQPCLSELARQPRMCHLSDLSSTGQPYSFIQTFIVTGLVHPG